MTQSTLVTDVGVDNRGFTTFSLPDGILDLHKTFECGQCFRWNQLNDGSYKGVIEDKLVFIMDETNRQSYNDGRRHYLTTWPEDKLFWLLDYLSVYDNYTLLEKIELTDFERVAVKKGKGIRILNQDIWETLISFIISQRNNIPKIKTSIERLCMAAGTRLEFSWPTKPNPFEYYTFPTDKQIIALGGQGLKECGLGYRSEYVLEAARIYSNNKDNFYLMKSRNVPGDTVVQNLMELKGVGPKVANCVALFGFKKLDMFPIDVWIQRAIDTYYNGSIDTSKFGDLSGLMQQYMFYFMR